MNLTYLNKKKFKNWNEYYWEYQYNLASEYYIPLLKRWNFDIKNKKILDIGCGNGGFTAAFGNFSKTTGIDIKKFPWKTVKNVDYKSYDIFTDPKILNTDYDLIILRDVIEHIPLDMKEKFIKKALEYGNSNVRLLVTFPPFYSPFGLHQQVLLNSKIRYIPFLSLIPKNLMILILKAINEDKFSIKKIIEMYDCKMTIKNFEKIIKKLNLNIIKTKFFYSRPSHEIRYNFKTRIVNHQPIPILKEFYILGTTYLIK